MTGTYQLTAAQAAFLEAANRPSAKAPSSQPPAARFGGRLPPPVDQSCRGTCVASAVAALVACYEDCRRRVSVQYLDEVTRLVERAWVERNAQALLAGKPVEKDFEAAFPEAVAQAALVVRANGAGSEPAIAFVRALADKVLARIEADEGCRLRRCFEALEQYGACREELWPYSPVALNVGRTGADAVGAFPPGTNEDARRHRIVNGLYVLRSPNNVDEIKGILAGANGCRSMAVCAGLDLFEGCTDGVFSLPGVMRDGETAHVASRPLGLHEVLIVGYEDDAKAPGGGWFTFQNSWGADWGRKGEGKVSYAYVACFCREAGTILQDRADYVSATSPATCPSPTAKDEAFIIARRRATILSAVGICLFAALFSVGFSLWTIHENRSSASVISPHNLGTGPENPGTGPEKHAEKSMKTYRFIVKGVCGSAEDARKVVKILSARNEFKLGEVRFSDGGQTWEGEVSVQSAAGHPPAVIALLEARLLRERAAHAVQTWSARPLRPRRRP